ncbi:MAG: hypothetical protein LBT53_01045 [Puniceicoccales bacterium]|jgi:hypothetical protein|nr:hypothetical protein [Puniceicoccales bacterium]
MSTLTITSYHNTPALSWRKTALYLWSALFVAGNLALPQICHAAAGADGGRALLPLYFFTLVGAACFGRNAGLLIALASPLLNHAIFGMPPSGALPVILVKSCLIAVLAPVLLRRIALLPLAIAAIVLGYQLLGGAFEWAWTGSLAAAQQDFVIGWPGMLAQFAAAWAILAFVATRREKSR